MNKEVEIGNAKFVVRELLAIELDDIDFNDKKGSIKKEVMLSTGISSEVYDKLTVKERLTIINAINEINGFGNFTIAQAKG